MSPEFVRDGLFKPFVSSKAGGFGIGAFEAREMVRAMGGRLDVEIARRARHPLCGGPAAVGGRGFHRRTPFPRRS